MCRLLADCGSDVDLQDTTAGETPLYYAIRNNHWHIVHFLIERGVNVNHRSAKQLSPLALAKRENRMEIVKLLLAQGAIGNLEDDQHTVIGTYSRKRGAGLDATSIASDLGKNGLGWTGSTKRQNTGGSTGMSLTGQP